MAPSRTKSLRIGLCALALAVLAPSAEARVDGNSSYSKAQTYSGALRYVRVDMGYDVVEKDPEAAYLIFKYAAPGSKDGVTGTLEVVESGGNVRLFVSLPRLPEYQERVFRDGLLKKLRDEYGPPAAKKPTEKPSEKPGEKPDSEKPAAPADGS
ncbi:MAG: hypothetical protein EOO73_25890 [Myxococcales bacterium]|nr:MAG: hypothetical protein EOO73_25890 [Myxococcales bacterium]